MDMIRNKVILERTQKAWDYLTETGFNVTSVRPTNWFRPSIIMNVEVPDGHYPGEAERNLFIELMARNFNGFVITSISPFVNGEIFEPTVEVAFLSEQQINHITEKQKEF